MPLMVKDTSSITRGRGVCVVCPEIYSIEEEDNETFERKFVRHAEIHAKISEVSDDDDDDANESRSNEECEEYEEYDEYEEYEESDVESNAESAGVSDGESAGSENSYEHDEEESNVDRAEHNSGYAGDDYESAGESSAGPRCEACGMDIAEDSPQQGNKCSFCAVAGGMQKVSYFELENSIIAYEMNPAQKQEQAIIAEVTPEVHLEANGRKMSEKKIKITESGQHSKTLQSPGGHQFPAEIFVASSVAKKDKKEFRVRSYAAKKEDDAKVVLSKLIAKFSLKNEKSKRGPSTSNTPKVPASRIDDIVQQDDDLLTKLRRCNVSDKALESFKLLFETSVPSDTSFSSNDSTIEIEEVAEEVAKEVAKEVIATEKEEIHREKKEPASHEGIESIFHEKREPACARVDPPTRGRDPPSTNSVDEDEYVPVVSHRNQRSSPSRDPSPTRGEAEESIYKYDDSADDIRRQLMKLESRLQEDCVMDHHVFLSNLPDRRELQFDERLNEERSQDVSSVGNVSNLEPFYSRNNEYLYNTFMIKEEEEDAYNLEDEIQRNEEYFKGEDCSNTSPHEQKYGTMICSAPRNGELSPSAIARRQHYKEILLARRNAEPSTFVTHE